MIGDAGALSLVDKGVCAGRGMGDAGALVCGGRLPEYSLCTIEYGGGAW